MTSDSASIAGEGLGLLAHGLAQPALDGELGQGPQPAGGVAPRPAGRRVQVGRGLGREQVAVALVDRRQRKVARPCPE